MSTSSEEEDRLREEKKSRRKWRKFVNMMIERSGLTQYEMADHLGCSQGLISKWCNGVRNPSNFAQQSLVALAIELELLE